jgi:hypothetical protein
MNRNSEQHYNQVPHAEIRRSRFKRDFSLLTTINEGDLVPIYVDEVLPGDTFKIDVNGLVRMATPLYPVMDNCNMDIFFFFVPCRLLWDHFVNMMGQNDSSYWAEPTEYTTPVVKVEWEKGYPVGSIADYMGIPTGINGIKVNKMPFQAYVKIWNEWFRDENLQQPAMEDTTDKTEIFSERDWTDDTAIGHVKGGRLLKVCKHKDYFTSSLPQPQKGQAVPLPLTGNAPLRAYTTPEQTQTKTGTGFFNNEYNTGIVNHTNISFTNQGTKFSLNKNNNGNTAPASGGQYLETMSQDDANFLDAWVGTDLSSVTATTINELRNAIAVQHILERDARTGTRYKEILKGAWGVTSPDARLDRSEYIGGYRMPININQVIQTSSTNTTSPQGNTAAYSMTTMSKHMCTYSATEHGYVLGLCCVRVDHSYQQGLSRLWTRSTRFSYYDPMLANLGEQPVLNQEIYAQGNTKDEEVFGYQEAWADYKYRTNMVTSEMRSTYAQSLDAWHYADHYTSLPTLSSDWIKEGNENIARTLAVEDNKHSYQFICNFYYDQTWTRPMPIYSIPGLDTI